MVHESLPVETPTGQHVAITLHRMSTGGTRHAVEWKRDRSCADCAMSGAERAEKKRKRAELFPAKAVAQREKDVERKRAAVALARAQEAAAATLEDTYLDIASYADELDGTTAAGATAGEWRERAANVRAEKLTPEQADAAHEAAEEAWFTARDNVAEEREAADRRGEGWWRELWSDSREYGMCEAWQGPLPPYRSRVCVCCSCAAVLQKLEAGVLVEWLT